MGATRIERLLCAVRTLVCKIGLLLEAATVSVVAVPFWHFSALRTSNHWWSIPRARIEGKGLMFPTLLGTELR
jgi:hypothetical protein